MSKSKYRFDRKLSFYERDEGNNNSNSNKMNDNKMICVLDINCVLYIFIHFSN